jgi:hypothetical protein
MMYSGLALPLGFVAFFIVAGAVNQVATGITPLFAGALAAFFLKRYLERLDQTRASAACDRRDQVWNMPFPAAYGVFRRALQSYVVEGGEPRRFSITDDDEQSGHIEAHLQLSGAQSGLSGEMARCLNSTLYLEAYIFASLHNPKQTCVAWSYRIEGNRTIEAERAITAFERRLQMLVTQAQSKMNRSAAALLLAGMLAVTCLNPAGAQQGVLFPPTFNVTPYLVQDLTAYLHSPSRPISSADGHKYDLGLPGLRGGGKSGRPLGLYVAGLEMEYRSAYPACPDTEKAQFAAELHSFVIARCGGFQMAMQQVRNWQPMSNAHVPYARQEQFAEFWFRTHDATFKETAPLFKDWWMHDAILDATNVYEHYEADRNFDRSSERIMYIDGELSLLKKKQ